MTKDQEPLVSVALITYNHESYIRQALDSVLMQKTDFFFDIVIGEDGSTDKTREIVASYQKKHPEKIRMVTSGFNVGPMPNVVRTYKACRGKYIAILEGDDYWTDPFKLQKQVEFLEKHTECVLCYTNRYIVDEQGNVISEGNLPGPEKEFLSKEDVLGVFTPPTQTILIASKYLSNTLLNALETSYNGDMTLSYYLSRNGLFGYINDITACYRQHPGGVYSKVKNTRRLEETLSNYQRVKKYFNREEQNLLNRGKVAVLMRLYKEYFYDLNAIKFFKTAGQLIINDIQFQQLNFLKANYWLLKGRKNK